jgi:predicted methyltransferase
MTGRSGTCFCCAVRSGVLGAITCAFMACVGLGMTHASAQGALPDYATLMSAPDRTDADRQADRRRDPIPFLAFAGLRPGMKVLDMGAGAGYSTELDARAVGPTGTVYGQNPPDFSERGKGAFAARLAKPAMQNSVSVLRPFDDPVPPDVHDLDVITFLFFYHDTTYMNVDRAEMDRKMFAALRPGGLLVIADHAAKAGDGATVGKTLHRIEAGTLRQEVEQAGFRLIAEGDFWRHPEDHYDFTTLVPTGPVDEFVLKFQKPM